MDTDSELSWGCRDYSFTLTNSCERRRAPGWVVIKCQTLKISFSFSRKSCPPFAPICQTAADVRYRYR